MIWEEWFIRGYTGLVTRIESAVNQNLPVEPPLVRTLDTLTSVLAMESENVNVKYLGTLRQSLKKLGGVVDKLATPPAATLPPRVIPTLGNGTMKIAAILLTYNRYPRLPYLVEESVESFIRQDYENKELLIVNDTPGQTLRIDHPRIRVLNVNERFPTLADKIQYAIDNTDADAFCRWDDDDISLPHRLSYSAAKLGDGLEWRANNYWFDCGEWREVHLAGNTHVMSLWRREVLERIGGKYPPKHTGNEDQKFNEMLHKAGVSSRGEDVPTEEMYYIYRWGTGSRHLSGVGGTTEQLQTHYDSIGKFPIVKREFEIKPRWYRNYVAFAEQVRNMPKEPKDLEIVAGYFNYKSYYDHVATALPPRCIAVEVGSLYGRSVIYLAKKLKEHNKRPYIYAVDFGLGVGGRNDDFGYLPTLFNNIRECGVSDCVSVVAAESTVAAKAFGNESIDFVFIDAGHDYNAVRSDLQSWFPKLRRGGTIGGHDWNHPNYPDVKRAVQEFFDGQEIRTDERCNVWEVTKKLA